MTRRLPPPFAMLGAAVAVAVFGALVLWRGVGPTGLEAVVLSEPPPGFARGGPGPDGRLANTQLAALTPDQEAEDIGRLQESGVLRGAIGRTFSTGEDAVVILAFEFADAATADAYALRFATAAQAAEGFPVDVPVGLGFTTAAERGRFHVVVFSAGPYFFDIIVVDRSGTQGPDLAADVAQRQAARAGLSPAAEPAGE